MKLSMVIQGPFWLVGKLEGGKVFQPRIYRIIDDPKQQGQKLIQLEPFPHFPPYVAVGPGALSYPILDRERNLIELYEKVTSPEAEASYDPNPKKSNLVELKGGRSGVILPGGN